MRSRSTFLLAATCAAALLCSGSILAQSTTLSINGVPPSGTNGTSITVENGTVMTLLIEDLDAAFGRYGLFGAPSDNSNPTGWWLDDDGVSDPYAIVTGIATDTLDAQLFGLGIDIDFTPSRPGSPAVRLNSLGRATLRFRIPTGLVGTVNLQAAATEVGLTASRFSTGVQLNIVNPVRNARMLVAKDIAGSADDLDFGVLEFTGNPATGGAYTASGLTSTDIQPINLAGIKQWHPHNASGNDLPDDLNVYREDGPAARFDNIRFPSIALPPAAGTDGVFGTSDDIPARELLRCFDNITLEGFFVIVEKGTNPNHPTTDYYQLEASRRTDDAGGNPWRSTVAINRDGTLMLAVSRGISAGTADNFYLVALDGSQRFRNSSNSPVDAIRINPATPAQRAFVAGAYALTKNNVFFVLHDLAGDLDADGIDHHLYWADVNQLKPAAAEVAIPVTGASVTPDIVSATSFLLSTDESVLVFLAGDTANTLPVPNLQNADWYRVRDDAPDSPTNFTQFGLVATDASAPEFFEPGNGYNGQTGFASLSPSGDRLGFVARHHGENGTTDDDEVYSIATNSTETNRLDRPITVDAVFETSTTPALNNAQDLRASSSGQLTFFYGSNDSGHTGNRTMDLFHHRASTGDVTNLTKTGDSTVPFTTAGTIYPEGYFAAPGGRYLYFARGSGTDTTTVNLVGIDLQKLSAFNITGAEFGGVDNETTANAGAFGNNFTWQLRYSGGVLPSLIYFASTANGGSDQQIWAFDVDFPFAAFRLTSLAIGSTLVESLSPAPDIAAVAWSSGVATISTDVRYFDLTMGFVDNVTESGATDRLSLGSIRFVPAAESGGSGGGAGLPGLVYGTGSAGTADNPTNALFSHVLIDGSTNQTGDTIVDQNGLLIGNIIHVFYAGH